MYGSYNCDCGLVHTFSVKCLLTKGAYRQAAAFLSDFAPFLSRVAIFYDDEKMLNTFITSVKKEYRTTTVYASVSKKKIELMRLPEDTKIIVAVGSERAIDSAKYKAHLLDLPLVVSSFPYYSALSSQCVLNDDGALVSCCVNKPRGYIFDTAYPINRENRAELFGQISARLISAFEYYAAGIFDGGKYCPFIAGGLSDIAAKTIISLKDASKDLPFINEILLTASLKQAIIVSSGDVCTGGEIQCGLTYAMLNQELSQPSAQFVFAAVLNKLYLSHVFRRKSFTPPPDNNLRLQQISELIGISEYKALNKICPQLSAKAAAILEYKINEYRIDITQKLRASLNLFKLAFRTFKRLRDDDGYALSAYKSADVSLCIALAPDVIKGQGMLTALKRLGELDCYIV
ncbi:MAG: hypothetical protein IKC35_03620 [Clostridia bacterium]|nr:hypothetical protein [Clostridia bacterium]